MTQPSNADAAARWDAGATPLTARSVLASALLGMDPPELPVAQLVRLTGLFGISENRARVALSRMVAAGEAVSDGSGRYRLAGHLAARQSRQSTSRSGRTGVFDGRWTMAVITTSGSTAEVRAARRRVLAYARMAELREGVWLRPENLEVSVPVEVRDDIEVLHAEPEDPGALSARLWDLAGWSARADALVGALEALDPRLVTSLAPGFEMSAAVLRHLQADPLLPDVLLPDRWPGRRLRTVYDEWDAGYRATLRSWSRDG